MKAFLARWVPLGAWAGFLLYLGTTPGDALPHGGLWDAAPDKLVHALLYGVLGFLLAHALGLRRPGRALLVGGLGALAWGALDEWNQAHIAGRSSELADVAADLVGGALGGWLRARLRRTDPAPDRS